MSGYRKFSETSGLIAKIQKQGCPPSRVPKVSKVPKASLALDTLDALDGASDEFQNLDAISPEPDADTLDALGTLGGAPGDFQNSESDAGGESWKCIHSPSKAAKAPKADDLEEHAGIVEEGSGVPRAWAEGYAALCAMPPPGGFWPKRWQRVVNAAGTFLDRWAAVAIACNWSDLDIFGCHPIRPDARFDAMGLVLLLDRCEVVAIDEHGADLLMSGGNRLRFYRRPLPPGTISLWQLTGTPRR